ncbi:hypothetical protein CM19_08960 [Candidatus Acidianus copahuensis]|uniref:DUF106 domain-containing protein n=1 Tax=Candidatus Acidianus copahuensis TaxID=1160895 RepID=A0A031LKH2_9CREN|nr:hypothetical protein CM19_08960 [Candidatus Acidianus copahuensis]
MQIDIFLIILISFLSNMLIFLVYKAFLGKKIESILVKLREYDERLNKISSSKRRERIYNKVSKQIKSYNSSLYFYSMLQSILLIVIYMIDLYIVISHFQVNLYLPFEIPILTLTKNGQHLLLGSTLILFILSFVLFTPLSLRRPKVI